MVSLMLLGLPCFVLAFDHLTLARSRGSDLAQDQTCLKYTCKPDKELWPAGFCSIQREDSVVIKPCPDGLDCDFDTGYCQNKTESKAKALPGDYCTLASDCHSYNCTNNACVGSFLLEDCKSTSDCHIGLRCNYGACWPQLPEDDWGCSTDYDCENNLGCHFASHTTTRGNCVRYMSLSKEPVTDCKDYAHRLCNELTCLAVNGQGYGVCTDAFETDFSLEATCDDNSDCKAKNDKFTVNSDCVCGYSSKGKSHCRPALGDAVGLQFSYYLKKWYGSDEILQCHSLRREASSCMEKWEKYDDLLFAYYGYYLGAEVHQNLDCVKETLTSDYWEVYQEPDSSASVITASLLVLVGLA